MIGEVSWVTLARPFAKRRAVYRKKAVERYERAFDLIGEGQSERLEDALARGDQSQCCAEAIDWMWSDLVRTLSRPVNAPQSVEGR